MIVISDTTPLISLMKAEHLDLLEKLYGKVIVPEAVYNELTTNMLYADESRKIRECTFIIVEQVENLKSVDILWQVTGLDAGESEALILYGEKKADLLLMDERKGRNVARQMSVDHINEIRRMKTVEHRKRMRQSCKSDGLCRKGTSFCFR